MSTTAFIAPASLSTKSAFAPSSSSTTSSRRPDLPHHAAARPAGPRMASFGYSPVVDEFFAKDVRAQYVAKACPTGVPPLQCIEGTTFDEPYESRTLKRQSQLRYRQLPTAVKIRNKYETRHFALAQCHGCSHEEGRVLNNPLMASAMAIGSAEASRACSRYIESSGPAEDMMVRSVENIYSKAVNPSGVFSTACTDGQAKNEAYLMQQRFRSTEFRAKQYSTIAKESAKFAARKQAIARDHICIYEDGLYAKYPKMAGSMRPANGYYTPFVTSPAKSGFIGRVDAAYMTTTQMAITAAGAAIGTYALWAFSNAGGL